MRHTPVLTAASLSERLGGAVALKAENLQRTGSFKLRGALVKLRRLDAPPGVVAGSAGNHAQAVAYAARILGVRCRVFMPVDASVSKLAAVRAFGADVTLEGSAVADCVAQARAFADEHRWEFVHPFDDLDIVAGQAGLGIELSEDVGDLAEVLVPVGGGGLASGVALAVKQRDPGVRVVGVQAERRAPAASIADGIAIKSPGEVTAPLLEEWVDEIVCVDEDAIADAMVLLLERSKLVVEGAGAVSLAALMSGAAAPARDGTTVAVLSGGNVDAGLVAALAVRKETEAGRRLHVSSRVPDRPGGLAALLAEVARAGGNVLAVNHVRDEVGLHVRETGVELTIETRGEEHADGIVAALRAADYPTATS